MKNKKTIIGIILFVVLIGTIILIKYLKDEKGVTLSKGLTTVYVATGGGKEDFLADEDIKKILEKKYKLNVVYDTWSNGKTIVKPLIRESVNLGNQDIINKLKNNEDVQINTSGVSKYDALFTSDQRFYDYYKLSPNKEENEADRYTVLEGGLTLNTPIVIYSWGDVVDALVKEKIVTETDGVYFITDMDKLISYILEGKKWKDIGLNLYGQINIASTDPVTSSPGATYYGLLLSILSEAQVTNENVDKNLPKLKEFYVKSGYMNNTPADLFERYLKTGMGGEPMIVDYEKSVIDFANSSPDAFNQVKDDIRVLYPTPTIWNSHCFAAFTENGQLLYSALNDPEIGQIAWEKYGFRVSSLKMDTYNKLIDYLKNN